MTTQGLYKDGFYKVAQEGGTFVLVTLFNPETCEERHEVARDYDFLIDPETMTNCIIWKLTKTLNVFGDIATAKY